uniref:GPC3/5 n=1 Tax=Platynereis dumerilii TaxID=6359 RepID=A0A1B1M0N0_PLADU|nr:GPC3/5 [Platynereis dumerilii]
MSGTAKSCESVKEYFSTAKIGSPHIVPAQAIHDPEMEVCYKGNREPSRTSCCSRKMERRYHQAAEKDFYEVIRSTSSYLKNLLSVNAAQYKEQYLTLIQVAENNTETLFAESHKIPLAERRSLLENLFLDLQAYVQRREVNLHESVASFFDDLFPLVFHNILNDPTATSLSEDYKECLTEIRQNLSPQPFGEVPRRLAHQLSKALLTAKTFLESLSLGIEAINTTDHITLEPQCTRALTRLRYCSHCDGFIEARPCRNFCYNVMRGCLAAVGQIDRHWNEFVDSIKALTMNMRGYYSMENVLNSLHTRISEAVLHALETGHKYYAQIVDKCGHPKRADSSQAQVVIPTPRSDTDKDTKESLNYEDSSSEDGKSQNMYSRIETFMRSLMASKGFYHSLADTMCSAEKFATGLDQDRCWNGETQAKYNKSLVDVDLAAQMEFNPEMKVGEKESTAITTLIDKLIHVKKKFWFQLLTSKMHNEGMQADEWPKRDPYELHYGGSEGSGGHNPYPYPNYYGQMDDDEDYFSGYNAPRDRYRAPESDDVYVGKTYIDVGSGRGPWDNQDPSSGEKPPYVGPAKGGVNERPSYNTDDPEDIGFEDPTPPPVSSGGRQPEKAGSKAPSIRPSLILFSWISLLSLCLWFNG